MQKKPNKEACTWDAIADEWFAMEDAEEVEVPECDDIDEVEAA